MFHNEETSQDRNMCKLCVTVNRLNTLSLMGKFFHYLCHLVDFAFFATVAFGLLVEV